MPNRFLSPVEFAESVKKALTEGQREVDLAANGKFLIGADGMGRIRFPQRYIVNEVPHVEA